MTLELNRHCERSEAIQKPRVGTGLLRRYAPPNDGAGSSENNDHREIDVTYQHILYEVDQKIATVTLNRPDRMNAWTPIMERDVRHAMEAAAKDDGVRVIVLTGAGRAFCAGADMDALKGLDPNDIRRAESVPPFDMNRRPDWQTRYAFYPSIAKPVIGMASAGCCRASSVMPTRSTC
jgi:1,4-dihydroxy-2-naphthoyl-CoA synthase